ncbi:MAG: hypothetical protein HC911_18130, partial [Chloroflexaceae bacterium]|nr:hypothetical protein [Chloroflexaceae bacterium]
MTEAIKRKGRPCPKCGGTDRFYWVPKPHNGGAPHWQCRQCEYWEYDDGTQQPPASTAPAGERDLAQGYLTLEEYCGAKYVEAF